EWAEGAHLEPDAEHGHGNLRAVRNAQLRDNQVLAETLLPVGEIDISSFQDRARELITKLACSNRQLLKLFGGMSAHRPVASPFVPMPLYGLLVSESPSNSRAHIDNINSGNGNYATIPAGTVIDINGWVVCGDEALSRDRPIFLRLVSAEQSSGPRTSFVSSI